MARPIQATPKLNKEQTIHFVNRIWSEQGEKDVINLYDSVKEIRGMKDAARDMYGDNFEGAEFVLKEEVEDE